MWFAVDTATNHAVLGFFLFCFALVNIVFCFLFLTLRRRDILFRTDVAVTSATFPKRRKLTRLCRRLKSGLNFYWNGQRSIPWRDSKQVFRKLTQRCHVLEPFEEQG